MSSLYPQYNTKFKTQPGFPGATASAPVSLATSQTSPTIPTNTNQNSITAQLTAATLSAGNVVLSVQQSVDGVAFATASSATALSAPGTAIVGPVAVTAPFYRVVATASSATGTGYAAVVTQERA